MKKTKKNKKIYIVVSIIYVTWLKKEETQKI